MGRALREFVGALMQQFSTTNQPGDAMSTGDTIIGDQQSAANYDRHAQATHWFGPEVVFGLCYEFVSPGDSLLDLGIGSGLSSINFHRAGLRVSGLDGSNEVLRVCAAKDFAVDLKRHDLRALPLPYPDKSFDHVISVAVLNSFRTLGPLFAEVARIVAANGIFAFTVEGQQPGQDDSYAINRVDVSEKARDETAVTLFRHRASEIAELLARHGFLLLKAQEFLAFEYPAENRSVYFKAYVTRRLHDVI